MSGKFAVKLLEPFEIVPDPRTIRLDQYDDAPATLRIGTTVYAWDAETRAWKLEQA